MELLFFILWENFCGHLEIYLLPPFRYTASFKMEDELRSQILTLDFKIIKLRKIAIIYKLSPTLQDRCRQNDAGRVDATIQDFRIILFWANHHYVRIIILLLIYFLDLHMMPFQETWVCSWKRLNESASEDSVLEWKSRKINIVQSSLILHTIVF